MWVVVQMAAMAAQSVTCNYSDQRVALSLPQTLISVCKYPQIAFSAASTAFATKFVPRIRFRSKASLISSLLDNAVLHTAGRTPSVASDFESNAHLAPEWSLQ
jgi:hypothetical protein